MDFYNIIFNIDEKGSKLYSKKEGRFVTINDRHVFIGGPRAGGGGTGGGASKPAFQIGITSARPGKPLEQIEKEMEEFRSMLAETPAENVRVQLGTGGWEGGSEPTFITSYEGNGETLSMLAQAGKKWEQDGVLVMQQVTEGGEPQSRLTFGKALDSREMTAIEQTLVRNEIGGWTWGRDGDQTMLMAVNVPQWGGDASQHRSGIQSVIQSMANQGLNVDFEELQVLVTAMDDSNYDNFID